MKEAQCENCTFFKLQKLYAQNENINGWCRRFAPTIVVVNNESQTMWPKVLITDWCGEYEKRS